MRHGLFLDDDAVMIGKHGLAVEHPAQKFTAGLAPDMIGVSAVDIGFLNELFVRHPEWRLVIELGTWSGITAMLLGLVMRCRGGRCVSINKNDVRLPAVQTAWLDNMEFRDADLLPEGGGGHPMVGQLIHASEHPCCLICDNGDKPKEVELYQGCLRAGDGLIVHDFREEHYDAAEISPEMLTPIVRDHPETWRPELWSTARQLGSGFRVWIRQ